MFTVLLFWGWQTNLFLMGLLLGVVIEGSRILQSRWEFHPADFGRIWNLCTILFVGASVYGFASNDGATAVTNLLETSSPANRTVALANTTKSVLVLFQWLPMVFAPIMAAQVYGNRESIDVSKFSWLARRRAQRHASAEVPAQLSLNVSFPFFALCLFSASAANANLQWFFPALVGFLAWALWFHRPSRYSAVTWVATMVLVSATGFGASLGLTKAQRMMEGFDSFILSKFGKQGYSNRVRTSLGSIGRLQLSGKIVYRLETDEQGSPPPYLREGSYNLFKSPSWAASRRDFVSVIPETETYWRLLPNKVSRKSVRITGPLAKGRGALPLPHGTSSLEDLPVYTLETNRMGVVLVKEGPGFVSFQAKYDKGPSLDGAPDNDDLEIPTSEVPAIAQLAQEIGIAQGEPVQTVLKKVESFFLDKFEYSTWLSDAPETAGLTPLARFLTQSRKGHCEYFATATVLLLRHVGIPTRYAIGYSVQEKAGKEYLVRQRHAHAWTLVYQDGLWQDFDTTPPSWRAVLAGASYWQQIGDLWSKLWFEFNKWRWSRNSLREYILWGLVGLLVLLLARLFWKKRVLRVGHKDSSSKKRFNWPGKDSELYLLEKKLAKMGLERQPAETFSAWLQRVRTKVPHLPVLEEVVLLHYKLRFDPLGLDPQSRQALREKARGALRTVERP